MTAGRRSLQFQTLDDVMADAERLLAGHETVGQWSLAQIFLHLSTVMRKVVDLPASTPVDPAALLDAETKRRVLEDGILPEGLPKPPAFEPTDAGNPRDEAEGLRAAIAHYKSKGGPVAPHRLFGPLSKAEWERLQCVHCAHHMSFAVPKEG
ncbi:DUF1569 domain-containing protein [Isosphaeraceae bacterium EP7]